MITRTTIESLRQFLWTVLCGRHAAEQNFAAQRLVAKE